MGDSPGDLLPACSFAGISPLRCNYHYYYYRITFQKPVRSHPMLTGLVGSLPQPIFISKIPDVNNIAP